MVRFAVVLLLFWELMAAVSMPLFCREDNAGPAFFNYYSPGEYGRSPQNFCIQQDKRGFIYVANQGGVLEYDGVSWRFIAVPTKFARCLAVDEQGTVYVGARYDMGFLTAGPAGRLEYRSLLDHVEESQRKFGDVWRCHATHDGVYFRTSGFLFRCRPESDSFEAWLAAGQFTASFKCGENYYIHDPAAGLLHVVNDKPGLVPGGERFKNSRIYMMVPFDEERSPNTLLIGTRSKGFFIYDGTDSRPFPIELDDYIKENRLYHGAALRRSPGDFALATLRGGLVIIDSRGKTRAIYNTGWGLPVNNVKYVFEDNQGNLWLGLSQGIARIEYKSPFTIHSNHTRLPGLVLCALNRPNVFYAGTDHGLFALGPGPGFQPVPGVRSNCYSLLTAAGSLLAATTDGVMLVRDLNNGDANENLAEIPSYVLEPSRESNASVWAGTRNGLLLLWKENGGAPWNHRFILKENGIKIYTVVEEKKGRVWLGTLGSGVLKVEAAGDWRQPRVMVYNKDHGLPGGETHVYFAAGHLMAATHQGLFRFDETARGFIPDDTLGPQFMGGKRENAVFRVCEDKNKNIWIHSRLRNYLAVPRPDGGFDILSKPFLRLPEAGVNAFYPDPVDHVAWLAGNDGLVRYDFGVKKDYSNEFNVFIRRVSVIDGSLEFFDPGPAAASSNIPEIPYDQGNLHFEFAAPVFEGETMTQYRCILEGHDGEWTEWGVNRARDYTGLDFGMYRFRVRARDVYGNESPETGFTFIIQTPWFSTWWALLGYAAAAFMVAFLGIKWWRTRKLELETVRLEKVVRERTAEVHEKNRQLEDQTVQLKVQAEKLKEMDNVKSRFFANISHEFRTPLTLIMGPLEQMLDNTPENKVKKQYQSMLRNSQRLLALINQLLELSRLDSGKMRLKAGRRNIIPFLKGITASFELLAEQNRVELRFQAEENHIEIYFNPQKLEDVMCNLLVNAFKFTPGGGSVTVSVGRRESDSKESSFPGGFLEISVRDTGSGIPRDQLAHIFDRFYQVEEASPGELGQKGSGIGLALAKELVCLHHGEIDVDSQEGRGTEFIIRLPMGEEHLEPGEIAGPEDMPGEETKTARVETLYQAAAKEAEPEPEQEQEAGVGEEEGEKRNIVLVVEDNADVREYIRGPLESIYTVIEASGGKEGIARAREVVPDLIVSDIMMPGVDGYELCKALKKDINTSHIPIVLLTAKASEESMIQGLETGADDYITKPFSTRLLMIRIKNLIELRRQLQLKIQRRKMLLPAEIEVSSIDEKFIQEFQEIIEKNIENPDLDIKQLCKLLYMGRSSLFRKVQALTGETPNQFIQSYRLERAARLLKANYGNVTEVAFAVGFSNTSYFTECFKKKYHQLPSTFQASESGAN
jgi:signal transduction histidine kinase/CheY-like chemotaxis protein